MNDIIIWIILIIPLGWLFWRRWRLTNSVLKSVISADAKIVKMRGKIGPFRLGTSSGLKTIPGHYITFEVFSGELNGKKRVFFVEDHKIGNVAVGDSGILTIQGIRFIGFELKS